MEASPNEVFQERKPFQVGDDIVSEGDYNFIPPSQSVTKFRGTLFFFKRKKIERQNLPRTRMRGGIKL